MYEVNYKEPYDIKKFDKSWGRHQVVCVKVGSFVRWCYDGP